MSELHTKTLCQMIRTYWKGEGYDVDVWYEKVRTRFGNEAITTLEIRSDLINGQPRPSAMCAGV